MSAQPTYQRLEYEANVAPVSRPVEVLDRQRGSILELFGPASFRAAKLNPESVPVVYGHYDEKPTKVGNLVRLEAKRDWLAVRFRLFDTLVGVYAAERIERDSPVSVEFEPRSVHNRLGALEVVWHIDPVLLAVAIGIRSAAIKGARIVAIHRCDPPAARAPQPQRQDGVRLIRHDLGQILSVR